MVPSAIIKCRDGFEFAQAVQFAREYVDDTFFAGRSTNDLICRWYVETRELDCKLCVRIQREDKQCKTDWNSEDYYRRNYPRLRQVNIEDYDAYGCYADIFVRHRFFEEKVRKTVKELEEYDMEKERKYYEYLDKLRESGVTNMLGAVPYLQKEFPELGNDRKRAQDILLAWMHNAERRASE